MDDKKGLGCDIEKGVGWMVRMGWGVISSRGGVDGKKGWGNYSLGLQYPHVTGQDIFIKSECLASKQSCFQD